MHEGHRQRLYEKLTGGGNLYEHELLEMLLFNAYPRKNTNPVAHALLERFSSINEVLNADIDELCAVEGVGRNIALYLKCVGACVAAGNNCDCFAVVKNVAEFEEFIKRRFRGKHDEFFELYLLDKNGRIKRICAYTSNDANKVDLDPEAIIKDISVYRPYGVFAAHNHVAGSSEPSAADDELTRSIQLICDLNNVKFYDHCIYASDEEIYSYFLSNRLDKIKSDCDVRRLIKNGKEV